MNVINEARGCCAICLMPAAECVGHSNLRLPSPPVSAIPIDGERDERGNPYCRELGKPQVPLLFARLATVLAAEQAERDARAALDEDKLPTVSASFGRMRVPRDACFSARRGFGGGPHAR